jgi:parallel beta-helix repeat protein
MFVFLLFSVLILAFNVRLVRAQSQTIYISADGSISPSSAPISTVDNVTYTFTGNINARYPDYDGVVVERNNIIINGNGYSAQGSYYSGYGLNLTGITNVLIKNINVENFQIGIYLSHANNNIISGNRVTENGYDGILIEYSSNNTVSGNNVATNEEGIVLYSSSNNTVSGNNATANNIYGIWLWPSYSNNNVISGNNATANAAGIFLENSFYSIVSGNTVTANAYGIRLLGGSNIIKGNNVTASSVGIYVDSSSDNTISDNNLIGNGAQAVQASVPSEFFQNAWDNGYPSGGNYWSDYNGTDLKSGPYQNETGSDGIGDAPYVIDSNNKDNYPLMKPINIIPEFPPLLALPLFMMATLIAILFYKKKAMPLKKFYSR